MVKQRLVQIDRIDGTTEYLSEILATIKSFAPHGPTFSSPKRGEGHQDLSHGFGAEQVRAVRELHLQPLVERLR